MKKNLKLFVIVKNKVINHSLSINPLIVNNNYFFPFTINNNYNSNVFIRQSLAVFIIKNSLKIRHINVLHKELISHVHHGIDQEQRRKLM